MSASVAICHCLLSSGSNPARFIEDYAYVCHRTYIRVNDDQQGATYAWIVYRAAPSSGTLADLLEGGRSFRVLTVIEQFTRECLKLEAAAHMSVSRVVECLEGVELRGYPKSIAVDNGTEFCSKAIDGWAYRK